MIFHITTHKAWQQALNEGVYRAGSLETEGFIHPTPMVLSVHPTNCSLTVDRLTSNSLLLLTPFHPR
jgi:uncharacterized protein (DUF952 family)